MKKAALERMQKKSVSYDTQITREQGQLWQAAFNWFNGELWDGKLPACFIVFQRVSKAGGYFRPNGYRRGDVQVHEIAMNPELVLARPSVATLSTLVHEMCHLWQEEFGKSPRKGYHDKQWGAEMVRVGLVPSSTGVEGGKQVGQSMTHYIDKNGSFLRSAEVFIRENPRGFFGAVSVPASVAKKQSKLKYECPGCGAAVWGKPELNIVCGDCDETMVSDLDDVEN